VAFDGINLGFAAQTDRGLTVPSIRNADKLSARELDGEIRRLTAVVRDGKGTPEQLGSGTFTLNNYGVFGVDGSAAGFLRFVADCMENPGAVLADL
jgi:2-oxoisovalerate dehydrogenase E2 component (dihydrolipoyl transacylase)